MLVIWEFWDGLGLGQGTWVARVVGTGSPEPHDWVLIWAGDASQEAILWVFSFIWEAFGSMDESAGTFGTGTFGEYEEDGESGLKVARQGWLAMV